MAEETPRANLLRKTYQLEVSPPPSMSSSDYLIRLQVEWRGLLESDASKDESIVHRFLEQHPCLLPGPYGMSGMMTGHPPFPAAVITKPELRGLQVFYPDFIWLSRNSSEIQVVAIEIETPHKLWFTESGRPHHQFTQAQDQLTQWRMWFSEESNMNLFRRMYRLPETTTPKALTLHYILIYGSSRKGIGGQPEDNRKRVHLERDDETYMTFDRLAPSADALELMTVRLEGGRYRAVSIPPTLTLGPTYADLRAEVEGKEDAAELCTWASPERREFVKRRFGYWDEWTKSPGKAYSSGDSE